MSQDPGVVDITQLSLALKDTWVLIEVAASLAGIAAIPGMQWVSLPFVNKIFSYILNWLFSKAAQRLYDFGFFKNSAIRKASQAHQFIDAINTKNSLPANISQEEFKKYERIQMDQFRYLVVLSN